LHHVGNCLLYCRASSNCDPAQRSQHFLIEVVDRPIANPKCDSVLRESFHVIPSALLSHPQETFGEQFCDVRVTQSNPWAFPRIVATFAWRIGVANASGCPAAVLQTEAIAIVTVTRIIATLDCHRKAGWNCGCISSTNHVRRQF
jgi:hypothetical protein